jgi:hypothetical protein
MGLLRKKPDEIRSPTFWSIIAEYKFAHVLGETGGIV